MNYPIVMTIAGSDSGGGAGIQADLKTITANGGFGTSVITALTAQNTLRVNSIMPVPIDFIEKQFRSITDDFNVQALKTGMLHNADVIDVVYKCLETSDIPHYVLDPVMIATSGDKLILEDTVKALKERLIPIATIITPNLAEAATLLERPITTLPEMEQAANDLLAFGSDAVLVKGWKYVDDLGINMICDILVRVNAELPTIYNKQMSLVNDFHGTGCTLSAAIATHLASGLSIRDAVTEAEKYMKNVISRSEEHRIGTGCRALLH
ncbi:MAG: bifunctional hydroxymethylpyrimidine kinase/phosphomethylpyrimidine kinase [Ignavibacteria bacterium]|jgi:hydroxymethylpyrimidine/phosphomethylpyrimidine kinase|nr:bifunctional hydroxymethylpyrimidine kinase/phosphomethylpyrimidine kinase [Ignavibacteria bacterium]